MDSQLTLVDPRLLTGVAIAFAFSFALPVLSFLQKERYLSVLSLAAAALWYWQAFAGFALVGALIYVIVCWLSRKAKPTSRWPWACTVIIAVATVFILGRQLRWERPLAVGGAGSVVLYTLEMWTILRLVTLIWEVGSGAVEAPSVTRYILWTCLPFTLGGPVLRLSQMPEIVSYDRTLWKSSTWWLEVCTAVGKLVLGIALGAAQQVMSSHWPKAHLWNNAVTTFITGPIGFYLTTAGYFHLMQVLGRPAGFKLPTSFNSPIGRENISAFWMNWNMTATSMFRDYLFFNRWGRQTFNIYFNTMVLFTLVGLWHGANAYWVLWGVLHGLLFCSFLIWRKYKNCVGRIPLRGTAVSLVAARVMTYVCVCLCWYLPSKLLQKFAWVLS